VEDVYIVDSEGRRVAILLWEVLAPSSFFDSSSPDYLNLDVVEIKDRRQPLVLSDRLLGYDPCGLDLSALDMLVESIVQISCQMIYLQDTVLDIVARLRHIETRLGIPPYDVPTASTCQITQVDSINSFTIEPLQGGPIRVIWTNPPNYNYTHVAIYRAIIPAGSLTPPEDNDYRMVGLVRADAKEYVDTDTEVRVDSRESGETDATKLARHFYTVVPVRALSFGERPAPIEDYNYPKGVEDYTVSSAGTAAVISIEQMNDYIWEEIRVYRDSGSGWTLVTVFHRGDTLMFSISNNECYLKFEVDAIAGATPRTTTTILPYKPVIP